MRLTSVTLIALTMLGLTAWHASATDYEFDGGGGTSDWHTPANWFPDGTPGNGDTATIPNGFGCVISENWARCLNLTVGTTGTLTIRNQPLAIGLDASGDPSAETSTINGVVYFEGTTNTPTLRIKQGRDAPSYVTHTINGSGTITACTDSEGDDCDPGLIATAG